MRVHVTPPPPGDTRLGPFAEPRPAVLEAGGGQLLGDCHDSCICQAADAAQPAARCTTTAEAASPRRQLAPFTVSTGLNRFQACFYGWCHTGGPRKPDVLLGELSPHTQVD